MTDADSDEVDQALVDRVRARLELGGQVIRGRYCLCTDPKRGSG